MARSALIQMRFKWNGSVEVYRIVARGVQLNGRLLRNGRVTWGQIDKLLPLPSGKPFRLPVIDIADSTIRLDLPYGRFGFAVRGRGNLTGGFMGRLAVERRRLHSRRSQGQCRNRRRCAAPASRRPGRSPDI